MEVDNISIEEWVNWLAQDASGQWWGYEAEPHQYDHGWYENEIGRRQRLWRGPANPKWQFTLSRRLS